MDFHQIYRPLTAHPFRSNAQYREYEPCEELKPYIRCFWGSFMPYRQYKAMEPMQDIVIPDTCMDIIFTVDYTGNQLFGKFCGIDDRTFITCHEGDEERDVSIFAIRFYPWSAFLFAEESMRGTRNGFFDVGVHFFGLQKEMESLLFDVPGIKERIPIAERYLLSRIRLERNRTVFADALFKILKQKGNVEIGRLSKEVHASDRQIERIFQENMGISPKRFSSLVRYQYLWNDVLFSARFQAADAVCRYGYADQSHMLHDFKRFHTMNPETARNYARSEWERQRILGLTNL